MSSDQEIAKAIRIVLKAGYSVTWNAAPIGKSLSQIHIHESDLIKETK